MTVVRLRPDRDSQGRFTSSDTDLPEAMVQLGKAAAPPEPPTPPPPRPPQGPRGIPPASGPGRSSVPTRCGACSDIATDRKGSSACSPSFRPPTSPTSYRA